MDKKIADIVNTLAVGLGLDFNILECYHLISEFCETTNTAPEDNNYHITQGLLVINDKIIDRVIPSPTLFYSEEMEEQIDYWEGKFLRD